MQNGLPGAGERFHAQQDKRLKCAGKKIAEFLHSRQMGESQRRSVVRIQIPVCEELLVKVATLNYRAGLFPKEFAKVRRLIPAAYSKPPGFSSLTDSVTARSRCDSWRR